MINCNQGKSEYGWIQISVKDAGKIAKKPINYYLTTLEDIFQQFDYKFVDLFLSMKVSQNVLESYKKLQPLIWAVILYQLLTCNNYASSSQSES